MLKKLFGPNLFNDLFVVIVIMVSFFTISIMVNPSSEALLKSKAYDKCMIENINTYNTLDKVKYICNQKAYGEKTNAN